MGKLYIDGRFCESKTKEQFEVINPYTGELLDQQAKATEEEVRQAIEAASRSFSSWKNLTAYDRAKYLRKLDQLVKDHEEDLARIMTLEQGKPYQEALGEVRYARTYLTWYAEEGIRVKGDILESHHPRARQYVKKEAVGPVAIITPWNFPLAMFVRKLAPALVAGCTAIVKPSSETPLTAVAFFELVDQADFPKGTVQLLTGSAQEIGDLLLSAKEIKKLSFTGSTAVGQELMRKSADTLKKLSLELGGHAPFIVFEDANLEKAVEGAISSKFRNCGQVCIATNRVFVQESIADDFLERLAAGIEALRYGDGMQQVDIGPLINKAGYDKVKEHVEDALQKGARLLVGGEGQAGKGYLYQPTLLAEVTAEMKMMKEETFGPVMPVMTFTTEEEVIDLANDTPYGLAAYFYTENLSRSIRVQEQLAYGMIGVNTGRISAAQAPFGGVKMSGFGREGGSYGIEEYLVTKYIALEV